MGRDHKNREVILKYASDHPRPDGKYSAREINEALAAENLPPLKQSAISIKLRRLGITTPRDPSQKREMPTGFDRLSRSRIVKEYLDDPTHRPANGEKYTTAEINAILKAAGDPETLSASGVSHLLERLGRERHRGAPRKTVPPEKLQEIISEGNSIDRSAAKLGIAPSTLRLRMKEAGKEADLSPRRGRRNNPELLAKVHSLLWTGYSQAEIATMLDVSASDVSVIKKKLQEEGNIYPPAPARRGRPPQGKPKVNPDTN